MTYPLIYVKLQGIESDLQPHEINPALYSGGQNISYDNNGMQKCRGYIQTYGALNNTPLYCLYTDTIDSEWLYAGVNNISVTSNGSHIDITPDGGITITEAERWTGGILNGVIVLSSQDIEPIYWDGVLSNKMVTLPGWDPNDRAAVIRPFKNFLVALNVTKVDGNYKNMVKWSDIADSGGIPPTWDHTLPGNLAGENLLGGQEGPLIDALPLGDLLVIYKNNSCYTMQLTGGQFVFAFKDLFRNIGALSKDCIAAFRGQHCVLTPDDVVVHDGRAVQSIVDMRMRKWIFDSINEPYAHTSYVVNNHPRDEIWICFPTKDAQNPNMALVWNYNDNLFSVRDLPDSPFINIGIVRGDDIDDPPDILNPFWDQDNEIWDIDQTPWNKQYLDSTSKNLVMCMGNNLMLQDAGDTFNNVEFESYVERLSFPTQDLKHVHLVRALRPIIYGDEGTVLKIQVGGQLHANDPIYWTPERDFIVGQDRFDVFVKGRFLSFKIRSESSGKWQIKEIGIEIAPFERY